MVNILLTVPGRIAFRTTSKKDSAAIVGGDDAAGLLKDGDCLYVGKDGAKVRLQAPRVSGKIRQRKTPICEVKPFYNPKDDLAKIAALAKSRGVGIGEIIAEAVHEYVVKRT